MKSWSSNRTFMELKFKKKDTFVRVDNRSNRTFMELKYTELDKIRKLCPF